MWHSCRLLSATDRPHASSQCPQLVAHIVLAFLVTSLNIANSLLAQEHSEREWRVMLNECLRTQAHTNSLETDGVTDLTWTGANGSVANKHIAYHYRRNNDQINIPHTVQGTRAGKQSTRKHCLTYNTDYKVAYDFEQSTYKAPRGALVWHKGLSAERDRLLGCNTHFATALDGYIAGDGNRLASYLLKAQSLHSAETEIIDGTPTVGIQGSTPYGVITLWLAPTKGCLPLRFSVRKAPKDIYCLTTAISQVRISPELHVNTMEAWSADLTQVQVDHCDGVWIPTSGVLTVVEQYNGGAKSTSTLRYARTGLQLHPSFDSTSFKSDLPIGTKVTFVDDKTSGVRYSWDGTKPVPIANAPLGPTDRSYLQTVSSYTGSIILICVALLCVACAWMYYRYNDSRR